MSFDRLIIANGCLGLVLRFKTKVFNKGSHPSKGWLPLLKIVFGSKSFNLSKV